MEKDPELYNIVSIKNIDIDDFFFKVDNQPYVIRAGETRNFPKFMATLATKHLIDKLANREDEEGKLGSNKEWREETAGKIVVGEQKYEKPKAPTDAEIIEDMNESDLDSVLNKNKKNLKSEEAVIPKPEVDLDEVPEEEPAKKVEPKKEKFAGLKKEKLPTRKEMIAHARDELKLNVDDPKTKAAWKKMNNAALYEELQMGE